VRCPLRPSPFLTAGFRRRSGVASHGVPRPYDALLRVPPSATTGVSRPQETGRTTFPPVPPSGFHTPSADSATAPVTSPVSQTRAYVTVTPRSFAGLFHPASALGIRPSEPYPPGEPCRLTRLDGPLLPGGFGHDSDFRRGNPGDLRPVSPAAPPLGRPVPPRRGPGRDSGTVTRVPRGRHLRPPVLRASCPARRPRQSTEASGLAGSMPLRPLRSLAPPGNPYPSTARSRDLRPARTRPPGPVLSWDSCPSRACPTTTSGPIDRGRRPAAKPNAPGRPRPAPEDGAWRFDPEA